MWFNIPEAIIYNPPDKKKQLVKNCRDLSGDMYVLLAGEVDIETDLGVAQVPFLEVGIALIICYSVAII